MGRDQADKAITEFISFGFKRYQESEEIAIKLITS